MTRKARLVLADDHTLVRDGLRRVIEAEPDLEVVGEAANVGATIEQVALTRPDILLLDVTMPGGGGIAGLGEIRKASTTTRVLMLTMHDDPEYLRVALISGASGFLLKHAAGSELLTAVRTVLQGRTYVDPTLAGVALHEVLRPSQPWPPPAATVFERLSPREVQVLRELALGFTNKEIAGRLVVSPRTVEKHVESLLRKLSARSRTHLATLAGQSDSGAP